VKRRLERRTLRPVRKRPGREPASGRRGSVLIIVLWVAFGLVSLALYFAHSMTFELEAADNRVADLEAEQAVEGAARYVSNILASVQTPGTLPELDAYAREAVPVGDAYFWFIGRDSQETSPTQPYYGLVDEASKLNLNTASLEMLEALPYMTPEFAAAIVDWRDTDSEVTLGGAEDETYQRLTPARRCKNAPFESVDELRLVYGADLDLLYGEDANLNGVLDPNEDDGDLSPPNDNRNGRLERGLLDYVTVYSHQPGTAATDSGTGTGDAATPAQAAADGLINVNTASEEVLACVPGIGPDQAPAVVAYRLTNPDNLTSLDWISQVLEEESVSQARTNLTVSSYQFTADIAAVGHFGRGYRRVRFVFDTSEGSPKIIYRQDLGSLGWAPGREAREFLRLAKENR
jgi:type II secretory pathway component PulK